MRSIALRLRALLVSVAVMVGVGATFIAGAGPAQAASCGSTTYSSLPTSFRIVHFNVLGSPFGNSTDGYGTWAARKAAVASRMSHVFNNVDVDRASIYGVTEVTASDASYLAGKLGSSYSYYASGDNDQAVIYDTGVWSRTNQLAVNWDDVHGYVWVELKHKATGKTVNVIEVHLDNTPATTRQAQWGKVVTKTQSWSDPTVVIGDMNWATGFESRASSDGYCSSRLYAQTSSDRSSGMAQATYRPTGTVLDYGVTKNKIYMRSYFVLSSSIGGVVSSDHNMLTMEMKM